MPTRLDDATIRVRLLVDDESRRTTVGKPKSLAEKQLGRPVKKSSRFRERILESARDRQKEINANRRRLIEQARTIRAASGAPIGAAAGATRAALAKPAAAKAALTIGLSAIAIAKLVEELVPVLSAVIVTAVDELLQKASGGTLSLGDSGIEFIDGIANLVTEKIAQARGLIIATGRTFAEAQARARLAQATGRRLDPASLDIQAGLGAVFDDVQEIESKKRFAERSVQREQAQNFARQITKQLIRGK